MDTKVEVERCPLCRGRHTAFAVWEDAGEELTYHHCRQCGLVFQSPRINDAFLQQFYARGYRTQVQGTEEITLKDLRIQAARARFQADFCHGVLGNVKRHLDIGSSSGQMLQAVSKAAGAHSVGVEPGEVYRESSQEKGLEVFPSLAAMAKAGTARFDLISLSHVLEHIPDFYAYLCSLRETWLVPGGYMLIEVPNLFGHQAFELTHMHAFSPGTLRLLMEGVGFHIMRVRTHGVPRSPILNLYITLLARAEGEAQPRESLRQLSPLTGLRRKMGMKFYDVLTARLPAWTWKEPPAMEDEPGVMGGSE
ncbi:MAG: methyltransferase domain-containing protein [Anaerolineales bacterium]|nr:methyltransferase domain-containing protein [Anaerolineales bacterium]